MNKKILVFIALLFIGLNINAQIIITEESDSAQQNDTIQKVEQTNKPEAEKLAKNSFIIEEFLKKEIALCNINPEQFTSEEKNIKIYNPSNPKNIIFKLEKRKKDFETILPQIMDKLNSNSKKISRVFQKRDTDSRYV